MEVDETADDEFEGDDDEELEFESESDEAEAEVVDEDILSPDDLTVSL